MEAAALIEMTEDLFFNKYCSLRYIITDDDSKMKANCKWSNEDWAHHYNVPVPPKKGVGKRTPGRLKYPVPEPRFLADPAHRKKTLRNHLWKLKKKGIKGGNYGLVEGDILRLSRYFIYMARQLKDVPKEDWIDSGKAVLEHHFDNHEFCRSSFCARKSQSEEEKTASGKVYRSKEKDTDLYETLQDIMEPFVCLEGLEQIAHGGDTQVNESMNNSVSWLAPKNKTFCGSRSLSNRVSMACCVNLMGYDRFLEPSGEDTAVSHTEAQEATQ
jgi:hypothetical protein